MTHVTGLRGKRGDIRSADPFPSDIALGKFARGALVLLLISAFLVLQFPQFMSGSTATLVMAGLFFFSWTTWPRAGVVYGPMLLFALLMVLSLLWVYNLRYSLVATAGGIVVCASGLAVGRGLSIEAILTVVHRATLAIAVVSIALGCFVPSYGLHSGPAYSGTLVGIYISKNSLAVVILFGALAAIFRRWPTRRDRAILLFSFAVYLVVFLWTESATTILILVVGVIVRIVYSKWIRSSRSSRRAVVTILVIPATIVAVMSWTIYVGVLGALGRDITLTGRTAIWGAAISAWAQRPWTGIGWGGFETDPVLSEIQLQSYGWVRNHAHSGFIQVLTELGVLGAVVVLIMLIVTFIRVAQVISRVPRLENGWLLAILLAFVAHNVTEQSMRLLPLFMLCVVYGACTRQLKGSLENPPRGGVARSASVGFLVPNSRVTSRRVIGVPQ